VFVYAATTEGLDTISDFSFGTSTTAVDKLDVAAITSFSANDFDTIVKDSTAYDADQDVIIVTSQSFTALSDVDTFYEARSTATDGSNKDVLVIWQDSLGSTHVSVGVGGAGGANDGGDEYTFSDLVKLTGVTVASVADLIDTGDFIV